MARRKSEKPMDGDMLPIRNSTAEFLTFVRDNGADTIAVRFQDEMLWLTLNGIAELFDVDKYCAISQSAGMCWIASGWRTAGNDA